MIVFDRFTDDAWKAVHSAREHALQLNHDYLGTEHILLGLLEDESCRARSILDALGVSSDQLKSEIKKILLTGSTHATRGQLSFTSRLKKVLELSMMEADSLGSKCIGTEHLLLGLAREKEGVASRAIASCGMSLDKARELVRAATEPEESAQHAERSDAAIGDYRSDAVRLIFLEHATDALFELKEFELASKMREIVRKLGARSSFRAKDPPSPSA